MKGNFLNIYIGIPVWGSHHTNAFLSYALPTLMTSENLPFLAKSGDAEFNIFTDANSAEILRESPEIRNLKDFMPVIFHYVDTQNRSSKWNVLREINRSMIEEADQRDAILYTLVPDCLWSNQCLKNAFHKIVEEEYSVYMVPGYRTIYEKITMDLDTYRNALTPHVIDLNSEHLVRLGHKWMHPEMRTWYWDDPTYESLGTYISFNVEGQGTLAFCYNAHPVAVRAEIRGTPLRWIFDQDYIGEACPHYEKHYIVTDSRESSLFEMSFENTIIPRMLDQNGIHSKILAAAWNRESWYVPARKHYPKKAIWLVYNLNDKAAWHIVEKRATRIIHLIEFLNSLPDIVLLLILPEHLLRRSTRRLRRDRFNHGLWDRLIHKVASYPSTGIGKIYIKIRNRILYLLAAYIPRP